MNKKEAFKNWSTMNGWNDETSGQFRIAHKVHDTDMKDNPDDHEWAPDNTRFGSCWTYTRCKCGFAYDVDSSG